MGILLPPIHLSKTMKIQGMCDQSRERRGSKLLNGESESIPVVSMAKTFEDVEDLKVRLNEIQEDTVRESYDNGSGREHLSHSKEDKDGSNEVSQPSNSLTDSTYTQNKSPVHGNEILDLGKVPLNGHTHTLNDVTPKPQENSTDAHCNAACSERVNSDGAVAPTQDVSFDVSSSARFSKVLENSSLPLLYIPTTKQLIAQEQAKDDTVSHSNEDIVETSKHKLENNVDNLQCSSNLDESSYPETPSSLCATSASDNLSPCTDFSDSKSFNVHQDIYQDYLRPCDTTSSSHLFADDASLSSVSTGTDFSVSAFSVNEDFSNAENRSLSQLQANEDSVFIDINLHSRNSFDRSQKASTLENAQEGEDSAGSENKRGLSSFKILFGKKVKEEGTPGWKLFGKVPPKATTNQNAQEISSEYQAKHKPAEKPQFSGQTSRKEASEVMSTTALILEKRPGQIRAINETFKQVEKADKIPENLAVKWEVKNLPTKNPEEEEKHRQQYIKMVEAAKKKELRDSKLRKKKLQQQRKYEDKLLTFARTWTSEILPNWESMKQSKKARDLWWLGLPPNVRGKVWMLAIGNDLNITHELYEICHKRAEDKIRLMVEAENNTSSAQESESIVSSNKEDSVNVIKLDVSRTFPQLGIIQKGGPYHDLLHSLLGAYACYRPDVGYVQGMSFIAAILLLNMEVADAFVCFANVLNRPCQVAFFRMDENVMAAYYKTFEAFFKENLPRLHSHFRSHNVTPNLYLMEWVFLLFGKSLPLDVACRVWDVYCRDGEEFLVRTAIAILKLYESVLLKMDFIHIAQFLTKLPEDIRGEDLFHELEGVRMSIDKRAFNAVHAFYKDLHETSS